MKKTTTQRFRIAATLLALGLAWFFRPYPKHDPTKVHPKLAALSTPIRYVQADGYLDGGSLSVLIVDFSNSVVQIRVPVNYDGPKYNSMYFDVPSRTNGTPVETFYDRDSVAMLHYLIQEHERDYTFNDFAVAMWRRRGRDYLRILWRKTTGFHEDIGAANNPLNRTSEPAALQATAPLDG